MSSSRIRNGGIALVMFLLFVVATAAGEPVLFQFGHRPGEQYRIVGLNRQRITVNGSDLGEAEVLTRVLVQHREDQTVHARYQVSEESAVGRDLFAVDREYEVSFRQERAGQQHVSARSFVPQVQSVPAFPDGPVVPGESWSAPGLEVYDFREGLSLEDPVRIPISVNYTYEGPVELEGKRYEKVQVRYNLFHRPHPGAPEAGEIRLMTARFSQQLYWDAAAGRPARYDENYTLFIQLADGTRMEYTGTADGHVVDAPDLEREVVRDEIARAIAELDLDDATVTAGEDGVTISLEDIRFEADSARLLDSELEKLNWIATILRQYGDRDVLITGHTALAGTAEGRRVLSEERAAAVGRFLIEQGGRSRDSIRYQGRGADEPIASNSTPEGRRRNRRVEITILEN